MKKLLIFFICFLFISSPVLAFKGVKFVVESYSEFNPEQQIDIGTELKFKTHSIIEFDTGLVIPSDSIITAKFVSSKQERRFHKNGFFTCKLTKYTKDNKEIDASNFNMKMIGKRYEKIDGKEAAKTGVEFATATTAGFLLPGIDIAYYFVKGAVQNEKAETRFKSGVHNAYDNSIFWIFLKGRPIAFNKGDFIKILMIKDDGTVTDNDLEKICE